MCNTTEERIALKKEVEKRIKLMGLSKSEFYERFDLPVNYLKRLANPYDPRNTVPDHAIDWFQTFVMMGEDTPKYKRIFNGHGVKRNSDVKYTSVEDKPVSPVETKKPAEKHKNIKLCPKCSAEGHRDGAMYCYACGSPLKTRAEFVIASLESIRSDFGLMPVHAKDRIRDIIIMAVDYIKEISEED